MRDKDSHLLEEAYDDMNGPDSGAARELKLYIENDADLYRQQLVPIIKNIKRKLKREVYNHDLAPKLWLYLVDNGAKKYMREFDPDSRVRDVFNIATRRSLAKELADEYYDDIKAGEYDDI